MTVYFAQTRTDQSTVKIGFTSDLARRQINMSVSTPGGVAILATLPGNKDTEQYLHEKFAAHRLSGEWFTFADEIRDFLRDLQNGKQGLIPFHDTVVYMQRSTAEYARDAIDAAQTMATTIINAELRGIGDTSGAAMRRIEQRTGLRKSVLFRLIYRPVSDIRTGEYLHLKAIYDQLLAKRPALALAEQNEALTSARQVVAGMETKASRDAGSERTMR